MEVRRWDSAENTYTTEGISTQLTHTSGCVIKPLRRLQSVVTTRTVLTIFRAPGDFNTA